MFALATGRTNCSKERTTEWEVERDQKKIGSEKIIDRCDLVDFIDSGFSDLLKNHIQHMICRGKPIAVLPFAKHVTMIVENILLTASHRILSTTFQKFLHSKK